MGDRRYRRQNRRFNSPELEPIWAAVQMLDVADQTALLQLLGEELAVQPLLKGGKNAREARAVVALREAYELLGNSPSVREFEELRRAHPDYEWPKESRVRQWLGAGSWNKALSRAYLPNVTDGDFIVRPRIGVSFTDEEAIQALRDAYADLCPPGSDRALTVHEYLAWVRRPDVQARPGRRPMGQATFRRLFGTWFNALTAADVVSGEAVASRNGAIRPVAHAWKPDELLDALREVAARLQHAPTQSEYGCERLRIRSEAQARGELRTLPDESAILRNFGGDWPRAVVAAGLSTEAEAATLVAPTYTDDDLRAAIVEAGHEVGASPGRKAYRAWRERTINAHRAAGTPRHIPSDGLIRQRFGSWRDALSAAAAGENPKPLGSV